MARFALVILGVLAVAPALAHAQTPTRGQRAAERYADGAAKYAAKDYAGAAASFREAYQQVADPAFLFDIAQSYRLSGDCANAVTFYRAFLAAAPKRARHRAAAQAAVRVCTRGTAPASETSEVPESEVETEGGWDDGDGSDGGDAGEVDWGDEDWDGDGEVEGGGEDIEIVEMRRDDGSAAQRTVGLVTAGTGVLAAGLAAFFAIRAHQTSNDIEAELVDNGGMWTDELQARHDDAQRDDTAAIGLSIGSALAMVTGSVLWYLGRATGTEVTVTPRSDGGTVGWTGRF